MMKISVSDQIEPYRDDESSPRYFGWRVVLGCFLLALGWTGMGTVVIATVVSVWFVRRRGLAISLAFNGASFGGVIVAPLLVLLVEAIGFSAAMLGATAIMIVVLVPVVLLWIGPG